MTPAEHFSSFWPASWPVCSSASDGRPALYRRFCRESLAVSCDQLRVGKTLASRGVHEAVESRHGVVLYVLLAADVHFVNLDHAAKLRQIIAARFTEPMQDEPGRLLRDAYLLGQLQAADALAGRHKQVHGIQPLVQRNMGALENRAGSHGEILLALVAAVVTILAHRDALADPADRANDASGPEARFEVDTGRFLIGEHLEKLKGADCSVVVHVTFSFVPAFKHSSCEFLGRPLGNTSSSIASQSEISMYTHMPAHCAKSSCQYLLPYQFT